MRKEKKSAKKMTDSERVMKGLECCQHSSKAHCEECPYNYENMCGIYDCTSDLAADAMTLINTSPRIIHCGECVYWRPSTGECTNSRSPCYDNGVLMATWYCHRAKASFKQTEQKVKQDE